MIDHFIGMFWQAVTLWYQYSYVAAIALDVPKTTIAYKGRDTILACRFKLRGQGETFVSAQWLHGRDAQWLHDREQQQVTDRSGQILKFQEHLRWKDKERSYLQGWNDWSLVIESQTVSNASIFVGTYVCRVNLEVQGKSTAVENNTELTVGVASPISDFIVCSKVGRDVSCGKNESFFLLDEVVHLTCNASSVPPATFSWHNVNEYGELVELRRSNTLVLLVDIKSAGVYTCRASNSPDRLSELQVNVRIREPAYDGYFGPNDPRNPYRDLQVHVVPIFEMKLALTWFLIVVLFGLIIYIVYLMYELR